MAGLAVSFDGCPYLFTTADVAALPTPSAADTADWSTAWTVAAGFFDADASDLGWTERMQPIDGLLDWGGLTFVLHDAPFDGAGALLTSLATRLPRAIPSARLTSAIGAASTTFTVDDGSVFPAGTQVVWLDAEAIRASRSSDTFTVLTRGYYGSAARNHAPDATRQTYPTVWGALPWVTRRRAILWYVNASGVATALWRGYAMRAPKLHGDGARYSLQCNALWDVEKELTFSDVGATIQFEGYNARAVAFGINEHASNESIGAAHVYRTPQQLVAYLSNTDGAGTEGNIPEYLATRYPTAVFDTARATTEGDDFVFNVSTGDIGTFTIYISLGGIGRAFATSENEQATARFAFPPCAVLGSPYEAMHLPVSSIVGLPTSFAKEVFADGPYGTIVLPVLRSDLDDDLALEIQPTAATASDSLFDQPGPSVTGYLRVVAKTERGRDLQVRSDAGVSSFNGYTFVLAPAEFRYGISVDAQHWVYGLKRLLSSSGLVSIGTDARNWDWSLADAVTDLTQPGASGARLFFTGAMTVGDLVVSRATLAGCGVGVRGSRLAIVPFRRPLGTEALVGAITRDDLVAGARQTYTALPDGLANAVALKAENVELNVRYADSIARYGQSRTIALTAPGLVVPSGLAQDYQTFVDEILSRVLYLWGEPVVQVRVPLSLAWATRAYCGDFVSIREDLLPDGAGGRGLGNPTALAALSASAQLGFVFGREVDVTGGICWLDLLLQPSAVGYAPCVKIASYTSTTVTAETAFVKSAGDYADPASFSDGGARYFRAGDVVSIVQRDTTGLAEYGPYTVQSVAGTVITFTAALPAGTQTALAAPGAWHDLRYAGYGDGSTISTTMRGYAYVGSNSTGRVGTSTDRVRTWSP